MVFKVDIMKAYVHVSLNFLDYVMTKMGPGLKYVKWIQVSRGQFSILVNGPLKSYFKSSRRIRQKDPLSTLLLVVQEFIAR